MASTERGTRVGLLRPQREGLSGKSWSHRRDSLPRSQRARDSGSRVLWDTEQSRGKAGNESRVTVRLGMLVIVAMTVMTYEPLSSPSLDHVYMLSECNIHAKWPHCKLIWPSKTKRQVISD